MQAKEIYELLNAEFGEAIISFSEEEHYEDFVVVKAEEIRNISLFLRDHDSLDFDYLSCLSGMDYQSKDSDKLGIVYHLYSIKLKHRFIVKVELERDNAKLPTLERVWKAANWHEREVFDMYGVEFEDHPNMIRILCPYDWEGYPLRKDYKAPDEYHGMKVPY